MKIAIVTDSTAYLTKEEEQKYHITVVPMPVIIDGHEYKEGVDITTEEFYEKLRNSNSFPSTSQAPMGEMIELYNSLADKGYDAVISIHLASTISGFYNSIKQIAPTIDRIKVIPYDSQITVKLMGYLAIQASKMASLGRSIDQIINYLNGLRATIDELFVVDDLQNLVRGGRLSNASAFIGGILKIKPLLIFDDTNHEIVAIEKIRSRKKALKRVETLFAQAYQKANYPLRALVLNGDDPKAGEEWASKIHELYPNMKIEQSYFGPEIGTHLGDKALALAWLRDFDQDQI